VVELFFSLLIFFLFSLGQHCPPTFWVRPSPPHIGLRSVSNWIEITQDTGISWFYWDNINIIFTHGSLSTAGCTVQLKLWRYF